MPISKHLETFTHRFAKWAGSGSGLLTAMGSLVVWCIIGEWDNFSARWENAVSVYIGIITFLMIFLVQRAQNKEFSALQVKLNEIIAVTKGADNNLINAERLSEKELFDVQEEHSKIV